MINDIHTQLAEHGLKVTCQTKALTLEEVFKLARVNGEIDTVTA